MKGFSGKILNNKGSVMNVALLILLLLTSIVIYGVMATRTDVKIVANEKLAKTAFYAAEAGIERGRISLDELKDDDSGNWDNLLKNGMMNPSPDLPLTGQAAGDFTLNDVVDAKFGPNGLQVEGKASFDLAVVDNIDNENSPLVDTDDIIILRATGTYRNAQHIIETEVRYAGNSENDMQEGFGAQTDNDASR